MSVTGRSEEKELTDKLMAVARELSQEEESVRDSESLWRDLDAERQAALADHEERKKAILDCQMPLTRLDEAEREVETLEKRHADAMRLCIDSPGAETRQAFETAAQKVDNAIERLGKLKRRLAAEKGLRGTCQDIRDIVKRQKDPLLTDLVDSARKLRDIQESVSLAESDLIAKRAKIDELQKSKADLREKLQTLQRKRRRREGAASST